MSTRRKSGLSLILREKGNMGKKAIIGSNVAIDLTRLLETRLLIQANSGAGKSWAIRRLIEQTANNVQQIIIDPEGEFSTLREKFDFIICAPHGGDAVASPQTAKLLAKRLLETGVSAIIDIYDMKAHERQAFVRIFLESMVNAPKKLWHPVMVVLDEAHVFAPERGKSESTGAVIDIATRGRKRGQCLITATQRLSKLHKDVAAEMLNKMIGRTGLDIDVKRAADELGMSHKSAMNLLRVLAPGSFNVYGPAISDIVACVSVGPVQTTHPKAGQRLMVEPPAPSNKIRKVLAELADLSQESEQEARTIAELKALTTTLKRELTQANNQLKKSGIPESEVKRREKSAAIEARQQTLKEKQASNANQKNVNFDTFKADIIDAVARAYGINSEELTRTFKNNCSAKHYSRLSDRLIQKAEASQVENLRKGAIRILKELASRYPAGYSKPQVGALTKFSHKGGTFSTYMSDLRRNGFIEDRNGLIYCTDSGVEALGDQVPDTPTTHDEVMAQWSKALRAGAYRMLQAIVDAGSGGIDKESIAINVGMSDGGGTFSTYLSDLNRNGLTTRSNGLIIANDILFPETP